MGNPLLREMLAEHAERAWGFTLPAEQIYLSLGALDGLDKFFRGLAVVAAHASERGTPVVGAVAFPAPSFNVPEWQAQSFGLRLHRLMTRPEDAFKVTPDDAAAGAGRGAGPAGVLPDGEQQSDGLRLLAGGADGALRCAGREPEQVYSSPISPTSAPAIPTADRARMQAFNRPDVLRRAVLVNSFSKTHTLTGDRCGWVGFGDAALATAVGAGWTNSTATLPAEWQLRYMAYLQLFAERPELERAHPRALRAPARRG